MAQTIEAFVEKLRTEGVEAGKGEGEQLRAAARAEADKIVAEAKNQAEQIVADASAEAKRIAERERSELDLAARDSVLRLREGVGKAVWALLHHEVGDKLADREFLAELIRDVVVNYAKSDAHADTLIEIHVNEESVQAIADWALKYLTDEQRQNAKAHVDLKGTLKTLGFEYSVAESTVEVTVESITEVLKEQVSPRLREVLDRALAEVSS